MNSKNVRREARLTCGLVTALGLVLALGASPPAGANAGSVATAAAALSVCGSARPPALAARLSSGIIAALRGRSSTVGLTVDDRVTGVTCRLHPHWHVDSASVVKVTILSALLRKLQEEHRSLTPVQKELATEM